MKNRPIYSGKSKVEEYIDSLITSYNNILAYTSPFIEQILLSLKQEIFSKITHCRELLLKSFCKLNCIVRVPYGVYLFEKIQRNIIAVSDSEEEESVGDSENETDTKQELRINLDNIDTCGKNLIMASIEENIKYITMCSSIIRENYSADPLNLNLFLDKINLIVEITVLNLQGCLFRF